VPCFFVSQTTKIDKRIEMEVKKEKKSIFFACLSTDDVFFEHGLDGGVIGKQI
jgi:hypothetical protein